MRVLAFDSGAKRAGWSVLEELEYVDSGVEECHRQPKEAYQQYRMRLTEHWVWKTQALIDVYVPTAIVTETVPVYGMNDFAQGYLANVMATTVHAIGLYRNIDVYQVSATQVQNQIAIRGKSKKITKQQVRNGVISLLPELKPRLSDWVKIFEEPDSLAIGLYFLRYKSH